MSAEVHTRLLTQIRTSCAAAGFDLVHGAPLSVYNEAVKAPWQLPPPVDDKDALMVVVGNTRALWPRFMDVMARSHAGATSPLGGSEHPLDDWTVETLQPIFKRAAQATGCSAPVVRYAFEPPPRRVAIQRLAHLAGMAHLGPAHLLIHPTYGPWFALRAVAAFDVAPPPRPPAAPDPCSVCAEQPCKPALQRALDRGPRQHWRDWLAVRDACPVGTAHRYSDEQCHYHYAKAPFAVGK